MEVISKQDKSKSPAYKEFTKKLEADLQKRTLREGEIAIGTVEEVGKKVIIVDLGLKSSGTIDREEFELSDEMKKISVGSKIEVMLERIEDRDGAIVISRERARRQKAWKILKESFEQEKELSGTVVSKVKGGMAVSINSVMCFLPGSQISLFPKKNYDYLIGTKQTFLVVKMDSRRSNIVVSRKKIEDKKRSKEREKNMADIKEGQILKDCVLKSMTSWGAFFSYKSCELLCHINEMSWSRVTAPSDLLKVGQVCNVLVHKIEGTRISGSLKRLQPDPFIAAAKKYKPGDIVQNCEVQSIKPYGVFVNIEPNLCGLIHTSMLDHLNREIAPQSVVSVSQRIPCKIISLDLNERRLSLSLKDCFPSPWLSFKEKYKKNSLVNCKLKNKNDYAAYLYIEETPIVGMLHLNNFVHAPHKGEEELKKLHRNSSIKCKIIEIDYEKNRVQLSRKHLQENPFDYFKDKNITANSILTVTVDSLTADGLLCYPSNKKDLKILIKRNQLSSDGNLQTSRFAPGSRIDAMVTEISHSKSKIILSIKEAELAEAAQLKKQYGSKESGGVLRDIFFKSLVKKKSKKKK